MNDEEFTMASQSRAEVLASGVNPVSVDTNVRRGTVVRRPNGKEIRIQDLSSVLTDVGLTSPAFRSAIKFVC